MFGGKHRVGDYYAAHGYLEGTKGIFIVKASTWLEAKGRLMSAAERRVGISFESPARPWEGVLSCVDQVENREEEYYTRLGRYVYFFEE